MGGTYNGVYYASLFFHLLPFIEQKAIWSDAHWYDPGYDPPNTTPNACSDLGVMWPVWEGVTGPSAVGVYGAYTRMTRVPVYGCPSDPTLGISKTLTTAQDWGDGDCSYAGNFMVFGNHVAPDGSGLFTKDIQPSSANDDWVWDAKATMARRSPMARPIPLCLPRNMPVATGRTCRAGVGGIAAYFKGQRAVPITATRTIVTLAIACHLYSAADCPKTLATGRGCKEISPCSWSNQPRPRSIPARATTIMRQRRIYPCRQLSRTEAFAPSPQR